MPRSTQYDCVIIGGGHNGLVCAAYLARAGRKVCVLERRAILGGCASTEELWPGFRVSPAAYVISLFLPRITSDLKLKDNGLVVLPRNPSSFTPLPDGRHLLLGPDTAKNQAEIGKFSAKDAQQYPKYEAMLTRLAHEIEPLLMSPPPHLPPRLRDIPKLWGYMRLVKKLGPAFPDAVELLTGAATPILHRWFESEALKATLATDAIIGAFASPSMPGTAYVLLHHVMGEAGGARGVWGYVKGGMGGLADALERSCLQFGVTIRREAAVKQINIHNSQTSGVTLETGEVIDARGVASSLDANVTFRMFIEARSLPEEMTAPLDRIDYSSASCKINLALDALPDFNTNEIPREIALRGTTHIAPTLEHIERAYDDAKYGEPSREPVLEITMPTTVDSTLAPPGKHLMSMFVQYAPYKLRDGEWTEAKKDAFADRCIDLLARYAPNIRNIILHRQVLTPVDLERVYGLTGGNIFQGAMHLHQLGPLRQGYTTPIRGLFMCGAATHPGGGVMGACGLNAAGAILKA
ncbi:MAG: NAD(P)/FAD-dependent oxidoreductase [Phycisphaeraceae bacterium]